MTIINRTNTAGATKTLFTNTITVAAEKATVHTIIAKLSNLPLWDPEVSVTEISSAEAAGGVGGTVPSRSFHLTRSGEALNTEEIVTVSEPSDEEIVYTSTGGRLAYVPTFRVLDAVKTGAIADAAAAVLAAQPTPTTRIEETLAVSADADTHLPLALVKPIAKHAFNANLTRLAHVIESQRGSALGR